VVSVPVWLFVFGPCSTAMGVGCGVGAGLATSLRPALDRDGASSAATSAGAGAGLTVLLDRPGGSVRRPCRIHSSVLDRARRNPSVATDDGSGRE
jgi:hypothetical protein